MTETGACLTAPRTERRPNHLWFGAALVVVLVSGGCSTDPESGSSSETTTTDAGDATTSSTAPSDTTRPPDDVEWTHIRLGRDTDANSLSVSALVASPTGLVAVGDRDGRGTAWLSEDGTTWRRVDFPPVGDREQTSVADVVHDGSQFIAAGHIGVRPDGSLRTERQRAMVWSSPDGEQWAPIPLDNDEGQAEQTVTGVATDGSRFVVVGLEESPQGAVAWISDDGESWQHIPIATADGDTTQYVSAIGVTATTAGFVTVGSHRGGGSDPDILPAAWYSPDGIAWSESSVEATGADLEGMEIVATDSTLLVAKGLLIADMDSTSGEGPLVSMWQSLDHGVSWQLMAGPDLHQLRGGVRGIAVSGTGIALVGADSPESATFATAWTTRDGETWHQAPADPELFPVGGMVDVVIHQNQLIAIGWVDIYDDEIGVWTTSLRSINDSFAAP